MAQEEMEVDLEAVTYPLGLPRIFSVDRGSASHSEPRLPVELVPHVMVEDYRNHEHDNDVILLDPVLVRPENVAAGVRLLSEAIQQIGERSILRVQQQPPQRRIAQRLQRASRPSRMLARSQAPLDSYFQVSRHQTAAVAPPIESVTLAEEDEGNSSDATVELSDTDDDDGDSAAEAEEAEHASSGVPNVGALVEVRTEPTGDSNSTSGQSAIHGPPPDVQPKQLTPLKRVDLLPTVTPAAEEDEGDTCTICFETWSNAGEHRLSALRCGHLFGFTCIDRWLKGQTAKCPQCNKKAKRSDIVVLYARTLKAVDTSEQERMKGCLEQEQTMRRKAELESAQCRLQVQVLTDECGRLRKQVQELRTLMAQHGTSASQQPSSSRSGASVSFSSSQSQHKYNFEKAILVSQSGCRVMSYCDRLSCLTVSQPTPTATFMPGCGIKKISASNMKSSQYVPIHSKQIRGLAFSNSTDGLLLSAALDSTIKLTSLLTNTVVQTYNTGRPVWSCCWCEDDTNYVYAGLASGSVLVYDLRDTSAPVRELMPQGARCPVMSLSYLPRMASTAFPCGGVLAGTLDGACFWEQNSTHYRPHILPLEAGGCVDIQTESSTRHCLVTYRPGKTCNSVRCVMMELTSSRLVGADEDLACSCNTVQTFSAGQTCKLLTKNAIFESPDKDGSILACAGDEATSSAMLWNTGSGSLLQKLPSDLPVLDICPFEVNQNSMLATLTEKMVKIYKWE